MGGFGGAGFVSELEESCRTRFLELGVEEHFEVGTVVLEAGRRGALHVISEGVLEVRGTSTENRIERLGAGAMVGEISFVLGGRATATVVAIERTMTLRIDGSSDFRVDRS